MADTPDAPNAFPADEFTHDSDAVGPTPEEQATMNDDQPSQPLTEDSWAMMSDKFIEPIPTHPLTGAELARIREHLASDNVALHDAWLADDALHLLAEVDRLRAENAQLRRNAALVSDVTPKTTPTSGIVVNAEPRAESSAVNNYAIGYSAGLRNGRRGR